METISQSVQAVQLQPGVIEALAGRPATVLVPSDEAVAKFAAVAPSSVQLIMSGMGNLPIINHVVPDTQLRAEDIPEGTTTLQSMAGLPLNITNQAGKITVECGGVLANVIQPNIPAGNVIMHVVDNVLSPAA